MKNTKKFFSNKKFKYGSAAVIFTCVCVAAVIIFNIIFSSLAGKFLWSIDMTTNQLFTLSDASRKLLKDVDKKITINFCQPLDTLIEDEAQNLIYQCAKEYEKAYDNISIEYIDILTNPSLIEKYSSSSNTRIKTTSVVVTSDTDFRTFTQESFFATDSDSGVVRAFDGELRFTTAILQLCSDSPIAYFSTGHGETVGSANNRPDLWKLFENAGYEVKTIDLTKEEFNEEAQVLIVNDPKRDFWGMNDEVNEIDKIVKYLNNLGNLMVFVDPETPELPEFESLLEEWGIKLESAVIKDFENSFSNDGLKLNAFYPTETMGSTLYKELTKMDLAPKTVVNNARPLSIIWNVNGTDSTNSLSQRHASPVLQSYSSAQAFPYNENSDYTAKAPYNLVTLTQETQYVNNQAYQSYVMVVGSTDFATDAYLHTNAYANSDILYAAMRIMGKETIPNDLEHKYLEDQSLEITKEAANNWTLAICIIAPVIVFTVGTIIQIRRKHL
ncbi:MAG: GldG family protein [Clostridia bacterium]|nr:GldG family protein [Clostridia bacterium]